MMIRVLITNRLLFGAFVLLIIIAGGCYLYDTYTTVQYEREAAEMAAFVRQWQKNRKAERKAATAESTTDKSSSEGDMSTVAKSFDNNSGDMRKLTSSADTTDVRPSAVSFEGDAVRVSPFGYGVYPEIPADFPHLQSWDQLAGDTDPKWELMARVMIKLWTEGEEVIGANIEDGLIFPTLKNTLYVKWDEFMGPQGPVRYISEMQGDPDAALRLSSIRETLSKYESLDASDIPSDITVIPYEEGGLNPHTFLGLPQK